MKPNHVALMYQAIKGLFDVLSVSGCSYHCLQLPNLSTYQVFILKTWCVYNTRRLRHELMAPRPNPGKPTRRMATATQGLRPPRYPTEGPLPERTAQNDEAALNLAQLASGSIVKAHTGPEKRRKPRKLNAGYDEYAMFDDQRARSQEWMSSSESSSSSSCTGSGESSTKGNGKRKRTYDEETPSPQSGPLHPSPELRLRLKSMYDGTGSWPKEDLHSGAEQLSWANIGYPHDESLVVEDFEPLSYLNPERVHIKQVSRDIYAIKSQPATKLAYGGVVDTAVKHNRTIENFRMWHGYLEVCKVTFSDCKVSQSSYSTCMTSREIEKQITEEIGTQPSLATVQWVAAHVILAQAGQLGGRSQDYWIKARDLAQQQLHINPNLEERVRQQMEEGIEHDPAFAAMLAIVKKCIKDDAFNPYFQLKRDKHAVARDLFSSIRKKDIGKYLKLSRLGDRNHLPVPWTVRY